MAIKDEPSQQNADALAVLSHTTGWLWIYLVGPFVGAVLAWLASIVIHTKKHSEEREVAGGEPK
jgi:hypothetical protein